MVDFFGVKRGRCLRCLRADFDRNTGGPIQACARYEYKPMAVNHCAGPSDLTVLKCIHCGCDASEHADLGRWETGEPMAVDLDGRRRKTLQATV